MEARGDLAGMRILVDTYNLRLPTGTGIKTYGLSLIEHYSACRWMSVSLRMSTSQDEGITARRSADV